MRRGYIGGKEAVCGIDWGKPEPAQETTRRSRIRAMIEWLRVPGRKIVVDTSFKDIMNDFSVMSCSGCSYYPSLCSLCCAISSHDVIVRREKRQE